MTRAAPVPAPSTSLRLGILASHTGSNLQAVIDACARGCIKATPVLVISNNSGAAALDRARRAGIPCAHLSGTTHPDADGLDQAILRALEQHRVDLVLTLGYMKKLGPLTLSRFSGRILNIHPALLPRHGGPGMYGLRVHQSVIASRDRETGVTIHLVEGDYDRGPIIAQERIPVAPDDTPEALAARVLEREHALLVATLARIVTQPLPIGVSRP